MRTLLTERLLDGQVVGRVYVDRDSTDVYGDFVAVVGKTEHRYNFYKTAVEWMEFEVKEQHTETKEKI